MENPVTLAHYLFTRLHQLGIESIHGVPGDYNLEALDYLPGAGVNWVGDANELNAGYAADGYARVKGIGAVLTTFGFGELSAINAVAGSYAEYLSIVHIAGSPSTTSAKKRMLLHHTLGDGDFTVFANIYKHVTIAQANLHNLKTASEEIDAVLRECWIHSRPVYIELPTDLVSKKIDGSALKTPIDLSLPHNDAEIESVVVNAIMDKLYKAKRPLLLIDGCVDRHRLILEVEALIKRSKLPTFVTPMGKSAVDETLVNFAGVYAGHGSFDSIREFVEGSDLVISIGAIKSDFNTTGFTYHIPQLNSVDLHTNVASIGHANYPVRMKGVIEALTTAIDSTKLSIQSLSGKRERTIPAHLQSSFPASEITHDYLWPALSDWLRPNDILVTETGTAYLGVWDTTFPTGVKAISQTLWGSIGYALPAAQGAALAAREQDKMSNSGHKRRVILFEGDGSAQLTAQAIGTMLKLNLDIIIFLINNDGYTIERWVHGMEEAYNDVPRWKYGQLPSTMGGSQQNSSIYQATTKEQLEKLWESEAWQVGKLNGMHFVEMFMPKEDAPIALKMVCTAAAATNAS